MTMTPFEWELERNRQALAGRAADAIVQRHGYVAPIDPHPLFRLAPQTTGSK